MRIQYWNLYMYSSWSIRIATHLFCFYQNKRMSSSVFSSRSPCLHGPFSQSRFGHVHTKTTMQRINCILHKLRWSSVTCLPKRKSRSRNHNRAVVGGRTAYSAYTITHCTHRHGADVCIIIIIIIVIFQRHCIGDDRRNRTTLAYAFHRASVSVCMPTSTCECIDRVWECILCKLISVICVCGGLRFVRNSFILMLVRIGLAELWHT